LRNHSSVTNVKDDSPLGEISDCIIILTLPKAILGSVRILAKCARRSTLPHSTCESTLRAIRMSSSLSSANIVERNSRVKQI
ncbi:hypothetical protein PMAYCL1PPCAC_08354, partial [Pristionchus mayeri]